MAAQTRGVGLLRAAGHHGAAAVQVHAVQARPHARIVCAGVLRSLPRAARCCARNSRFSTCKHTRGACCCTGMRDALLPGRNSLQKAHCAMLLRRQLHSAKGPRTCVTLDRPCWPQCGRRKALCCRRFRPLREVRARGYIPDCHARGAAAGAMRGVACACELGGLCPSMWSAQPYVQGALQHAQCVIPRAFSHSLRCACAHVVHCSMCVTRCSRCKALCCSDCRTCWARCACARAKCIAVCARVAAASAGHFAAATTALDDFEHAWQTHCRLRLL
jgi:hypothetical protein